ncbi:MAG: type 1 glutamine amidotransferase domain-containing protein [Sphingobacteriaceae bacterium]|nr:type 1 glutamine amidotransferase domain-containing protein [Sphingobacteriaceae bacterium]
MKKIAIALSFAFSALVLNTNAQNKAKKVLFVVTSHDKLGNTGEKTGFWSEEFAAPYYTMTDKGFEVTIASPKGGQPPLDPKSTDPSMATEDTKRFDKDAVLKEKLSKTLKLADVNQADYDAVFYPGGHGPLWDLATDQNSQKLIADFYTHNKPVAFVCHAPGVLKDVKINGSYLVNGKKVTGFSNTEEEAVKLTKVVPFLLEDVLTKNGGIYSKSGDWTPYAVEDGLLITGQNPASSKLVAEKIISKLQK